MIENLNEQEKSMMLARIMEWIKPGPATGNLYVITDDSIPFRVTDFNLYDPANMALAWRVLNWGLKVKSTDRIGSYHSHDRFHNKLKKWLRSHSLLWGDVKAQAAWLDKILELAIEAGLVTVNEQAADD